MADNVGEVSATLRLDLSRVAADARAGAQIAQRETGQASSGASSTGRQGMVRASSPEGLARLQAAYGGGGARTPAVPMGGGAGAAGAAAGGYVAVAMAALTAVMAGLNKTIEKMNEQIRQARAQYAKQLMSGGMPGAFTQQRSSLANILGVSERDVFAFGNAVAYVSEMTKISNAVLAENTRVLAATSWHQAALGQSMDAAWSEVAATFAPVIQKASDLVRQLVDFATESGIVAGAFQAMADGMQIVIKAFEFTGVVMAGVVFAIASVREAFVTMLYHIHIAIVNMAAKIGVELSGPDGNDVVAAHKAANSAKKNLDEKWDKFNNWKPDEAPGAMASSKRMASSPWERMGLVLGIGGAGNYQKQTADNTKRMAKILEQMHNRGGGVAGLAPMHAAPSSP